MAPGAATVAIEQREPEARADRLAANRLEASILFLFAYLPEKKERRRGKKEWKKKRSRAREKEGEKRREGKKFAKNNRGKKANPPKTTGKTA